jgi:ubiquinone/menaquinone biosynthesis C-methylase UbiE
METAKEQFRPVAHHPPVGFLNTVKFYGRLLLDFQTLTIFKTLKKQIPQMKGKMLDVGCGNSPFEFLVNQNQCEYVGIDIAGADNFDYQNSKIVVFDGENIPFENESFENIICTEVIEHIPNPEKIISEMHRVLKPNGLAIITLPWSARVHFAPYDFCRYTLSWSIKDLLLILFKTIFLIIFAPILGIAVVLSHISIWFNWGSANDPLGYTITIKK